MNLNEIKVRQVKVPYDDMFNEIVNNRIEYANGLSEKQCVEIQQQNMEWLHSAV